MTSPGNTTTSDEKSSGNLASSNNSKEKHYELKLIKCTEESDTQNIEEQLVTQSAHYHNARPSKLITVDRDDLLSAAVKESKLPRSPV